MDLLISIIGKRLPFKVSNILTCYCFNVMNFHSNVIVLLSWLAVLVHAFSG